MAIALAASSSAIEILGIVSSHGNYPIDVTTANALKIVELLDLDAPVARGADGPLLRDCPSDPFSHGDDGQANNFLPEPTRKPDPRHGSQMIVDLVRAHPGEVTLAVTGPMTNLALALLLAPDIVSKVKRVVAISGAFGIHPVAFSNATGDSPQSEWNVYVDPEAAKIVYESRLPLDLIGLDVASNIDIDFTSDDLKEFQQSSQPMAQFLSQAMKFVGSRGYGYYCTVIDCMAIAAIIDSRLVSFREAHVGVETESELCRGMTVLDHRHHHVWEHLPLLRVAEDAEYQQFLTMVRKAALGEGSR